MSSQQPQAVGINGSLSPSSATARPGPALSLPPGPVHPDPDPFGPADNPTSPADNPTGHADSHSGPAGNPTGHADSHSGPADNHSGPLATGDAPIGGGSSEAKTPTAKPKLRWTRPAIRHESRHSSTANADRDEDDLHLFSHNVGRGLHDNTDDDEGDTWSAPRKCRKTAPPDKGLHAASGCGNNDARELSITEGADPGPESASSQPRKASSPERSLSPPSGSLLPPRSSATGALRREHDQRVPAGSASSEAAPPPGVEAQCAPSPDLRPRGSLRPRDGKRDGRISRPDSASEDDGDDVFEPPRSKPKSDQKRTAVHRVIHRFRDTSDIDSDEEDEAEATPRHHLSRRRYNSAEDDMYQPPEGSEQDGDDDDDPHPLPRKRHKAGSPNQLTFGRTATGRQVRLDAGVSRPRQVRTSAPGRRRFGRSSIPRPSPSQGGGGEEGTVWAPVAEFQEWPLQDAVLKRIMVDSLATFQLQFTWDSCADHKRETQREALPKRRPYEANKNPPPRRTENPSPEIDDQEEWEVEEVPHSRTYYRKLQYRVKWVGWGDDQKLVLRCRIQRKSSPPSQVPLRPSGDARNPLSDSHSGFAPMKKVWEFPIIPMITRQVRAAPVKIETCTRRKAPLPPQHPNEGDQDRAAGQAKVSVRCPFACAALSAGDGGGVCAGIQPPRRGARACDPPATSASVPTGGCTVRRGASAMTVGRGPRRNDTSQSLLKRRLTYLYVTRRNLEVFWKAWRG